MPLNQPSKMPGKMPGKIPAKTIPVASASPKTTASSKIPNVARISMICGKCSYKFSRDGSSRLSGVCPYCSSKNVYEYKPLTAEYFIKTTDAARD